ncbi:Putative transcription elongation factor SPT5 homolog 2 [Durusdinium trenchii]|uniref:Transcription elongation factor SPT5 homolog 2 n=1 Tax=Durusdinium trenchii TaxID=1381693 RepID=A0ABP0P973_9DINO
MTDAGRAKLRKKMNQELQDQNRELKEDLAARGPLAGAARLFSSQRLDEMEQRYQERTEGVKGRSMEMEDRAKRGEDISQLQVPLEAVKQTVTVPEDKDPRLWCLKTFGNEQELCIKLMWKAFEELKSGQTVPVYSVFHVPYVKGYIYLEAHREADVRRFTKGINGVSQYTGLSLVPLDQMAGVFSAAVAHAQKVKVIQQGDWVRLKRGPYRGDLAQAQPKRSAEAAVQTTLDRPVAEIDDDSHTLKIKPRMSGGQVAKNNKKIFPPKWFHKGDVEATGQVVVNVEPRRTNQGWKHFYVVDGELYRDGFVYKTFRSSAFVFGSDVRPNEYELADWRNAPPISEQVRPPRDLPQSKEEEDRERMPPPPLPVRKDRGPILEDGEQVIVHSGDLKNLRASVTKAIFGSPTVLIRPLNVDVTSELSIANSRLCKYFEIGDYVTVMSGDHVGDAGHVEQVELGPSKTWGSHATARILTADYSSFRASLNDLRRSRQKPESHQKVGEFRVGQLVSWAHLMGTRDQAGDRAMVLGPNARKTYVSLAELQPVQLPRRSIYKLHSWCEDKKQHRLVPGCVVKAPQSYSGGFPVTSEVLYIHQGWVFLRAIEGLVGERAYLVAPGDKCEYVWDPDDLPKGKGRGKGGQRMKIKIPEKTEEELSSKTSPREGRFFGDGRVEERRWQVLAGCSSTDRFSVKRIFLRDAAHWSPTSSKKKKKTVTA